MWYFRACSLDKVPLFRRGFSTDNVDGACMVSPEVCGPSTSSCQGTIASSASPRGPGCREDSQQNACLSIHEMFVMHVFRSVVYRHSSHERALYGNATLETTRAHQCTSSPWDSPSLSTKGEYLPPTYDS